MPRELGVGVVCGMLVSIFALYKFGRSPRNSWVNGPPSRASSDPQRLCNASPRPPSESLWRGRCEGSPLGKIGSHFKRPLQH